MEELYEILFEIRIGAADVLDEVVPCGLRQRFVIGVFRNLPPTEKDRLGTLVTDIADLD